LARAQKRRQRLEIIEFAPKSLRATRDLNSDAVGEKLDEDIFKKDKEEKKKQQETQKISKPNRWQKVFFSYIRFATDFPQH